MTSNQNMNSSSAQLDAAKMIKREKILKVVKYILLYMFFPSISRDPGIL